jgi:ribosomal protein S6
MDLIYIILTPKVADEKSKKLLEKVKLSITLEKGESKPVK